MPNRRRLKDRAKPKVSDEMRDLVDSLYRASDILLGNECENRAEAYARTHWARRQVQSCKVAETDLARQTGHVQPMVTDAPDDASPDVPRGEAQHAKWMVDVLDDLTQLAMFNGLEETRHSLLHAHAVAAGELNKDPKPEMPSIGSEVSGSI